MAPYKRARCETEDPEDAGESTNGLAKKPKPASDEAGSSKKQRLPRTLAEEQELNKLDQNEYVKITKKVSNPETTFDEELLARREFWLKFYAGNKMDTYPEDNAAKLNSHARDTVAERRKACPWYFWGLDGYTRQNFPEGWTYFYENREEGGDSLDSPQVFLWDQTQVSNVDSSASATVADKTESYALPLNELEKAVEDNENEISLATSLRDKGEAESRTMRMEAINCNGKFAAYLKVAAHSNAKAVIYRKMAVNFDKGADKLDVEVNRSKEILKQKQPLLEIQKLVLAARRANDSYGRHEMQYTGL
ncbi:hypothetical protein V496_09459 [Pseudogymnoascus sp. VKM F-4515 (FW-2607)]|nr:hypothetical protein V496_09459 [Pseudogymnoascus sp. VKM F-4515 (FW-2607)]KFY69611.1 hypothetical protein V498_10445 [Pseudogymnoascus sp. VKM F-4517 (FW-2822)]